MKQDDKSANVTTSVPLKTVKKTKFVLILQQLLHENGPPGNSEIDTGQEIISFMWNVLDEPPLEDPEVCYETASKELLAHWCTGWSSKGSEYLNLLGRDDIHKLGISLDGFLLQSTDHIPSAVNPFF